VNRETPAWLAKIIGRVMLADPSAARFEAIRQLRAQLEVDTRQISNDEFAAGVAQVAADFRRQGLDVYLLAAGSRHCGPGFILLM